MDFIDVRADELGAEMSTFSYQIGQLPTGPSRLITMGMDGNQHPAPPTIFSIGG